MELLEKVGQFKWIVGRIMENLEIGGKLVNFWGSPVAFYTEAERKVLEGLFGDANGMLRYVSYNNEIREVLLFLNKGAFFLFIVSSAAWGDF